MNEYFHFGRMLIIIGLILAAVGVLFLLGGKISWFGRLPGDILYRGKNVTFYFPIVTSIVVSIILSLILYFFFRGK
jgi:membrane protein implicated in regulation of membrane protease activity